MIFTPRRRAVLALVAFIPVASLYAYLGLYTATNTARRVVNGAALCDGSWRDHLNGCESSYSPVLAVVELLAVTALLLLIAYGLARWVMAPVRAIASAIDGFGPSSLGVRLRASGPPDETKAVSDAIDVMLDKLSEGYEAQRRFASNASHELRTPLATQRALIEVSLADALTPEQVELLSRQLLWTNERNERLIDGLLTLAETDRGLMSRTDVAFEVLTSGMIMQHAPEAARRGVTITSSLEPVTITGERALLERLVSNLLENAIKYNHEGGTVSVTGTADRALTVANTGPLVPADQVGALFEPFRRLSGERLDHGGGVGLGMTIVRSIVAAHGGTVEASANPDGGLTVTVRLGAR